MTLLGHFQANSFFYEKILNAQKRKSNQNQLTKQKQANKKQQKQQVFGGTETSKRLFYVLVLFYAQIFSQKNLTDLKLF